VRLIGEEFFAVYGEEDSRALPGYLERQLYGRRRHPESDGSIPAAFLYADADHGERTPRQGRAVGCIIRTPFSSPAASLRRDPIGFVNPPQGGFAFVVDVSSLLCVHHAAKYLGYQERVIR
jgi:hypothetical protein